MKAYDFYMPEGQKKKPERTKPSLKRIQFPDITSINKIYILLMLTSTIDVVVTQLSQQI